MLGVFAVNCLAGKEANQTVCVDCPVGTWKSGAGAECSACPDENYTTPDEGNTNEADCTVGKSPAYIFTSHCLSVVEHWLCGATEKRLSRFLPCWFKTSWQCEQLGKNLLWMEIESGSQRG